MGHDLSRSKSLRAAAAELALSPSALSRQLTALEHRLGVPLFDRSGGALRLTPAGHLFVKDIEPAFEALHRATARLQGKDNPIRLAASHSICAEWLLPRMNALQTSTHQPVEVIAGNPLAALQEGRADLAIKGGTAPEGVRAHPLVEGQALLVAAPHLADGQAPPRSLSDLRHCRRLAVRDAPEAWREWLADNDLNARDLPEPIVFDTWHLALEAAANGLGIVLAFPLVSERFLQSGRLRLCFPSRRQISGRYWMLKPNEPNRARAGRVSQIATWLSVEALASERVFSRFTQTL